MDASARETVERQFFHDQSIRWIVFERAAERVVDNWRDFTFDPGVRLPEGPGWTVFVKQLGCGILRESNFRAIVQRLGSTPDTILGPDLLFVRVYSENHRITRAFSILCLTMHDLLLSPIVDDDLYHAAIREHTLSNYRFQLSEPGETLSENWTEQVFDWFQQHGMYEYTLNQRDGGGTASKKVIVEALQALGLLPGDENSETPQPLSVLLAETQSQTRANHDRPHRESPPTTLG